jgi:hypothetical protein
MQVRPGKRYIPGLIAPFYEGELKNLRTGRTYGNRQKFSQPGKIWRRQVIS